MIFHTKKLILLFLLLSWCACGTAWADNLTLPDITSGALSAKRLYGMRPLPGSDRFARISSDRKQIIECSFKTGEQTGILFDVNDTMGETVKAIDDYILSPDGARMLIQTNTHYIYRRSFVADFYIYTLKSHKLERLSDGGAQQVPVWSPDGNQIAFVRQNNIYLIKLLYDNAESQVTKDGKAGEIINGIPDWVNEEEFSYNRALCFSADGTMICWLKFDETDVKSYSLQYYKGMEPEKTEYTLYPGLYTYKYPKAGEQNAKVSAWSFDIKSRQTRRLDVPLDEDGYMPRILPTKEEDKIIVLTMNRHQDELNIYTVNPRSTIAQLLVRDKVDKYIKEDSPGSVVVGQNQLMMMSDRSGYMHAYLYTMNGSLTREIGEAGETLTDIYGIDEANGDVYYQSNKLGAQDRQVYVSHKNGKVERLTAQEGWNSALFSGDWQYFVNTWSDRNTPFVYTIRDKHGKILSTPLDNKDLQKKLTSLPVTKKETFAFTTSEGVKLEGWMIKPANFDANKKYPVVMFQYSGPGNQQVVNSWNIGSMGQGGMYDYYLAQQGFIVVCVDGRGTGGRGAEFEKCTYLQLGKLEARDQVETALWLQKQSYVDKDNIGIWGWSYGGFCTLMSMSEGRGVFKAGVAVAPPTSYRFYDTVYTERFMRTPKENPSGYNDNPITRAAQLNGSLLLCHGTCDDNVHPQNTYEYTEALVQADKDFSMNLYTNRNHSIYGGNTRNHLLRQIANFFEAKLKK